MQMKRRPETEALIQYLESRPVGRIISYSELAQETNWNPEDRHLLQAAIDILQRSGQQFRTIRGYGYEKLPDDHGITHIRRLHNARAMRDTERMDRKVSSMNPANLSPSGQRELDLAQQEIFCRHQAEAGFHNSAVDERIARKRLRLQQRQNKEQAKEISAFVQLAKAQKLG